MSERDVSPGGLPFPVKPRIIIIAIIVIGVLSLAMSSFYIVDQTEEAVVLLLGQFKTIKGPGLQFKLPFGIEKNYNVPTKVVQNELFGYRTDQPGITTVYSRADYPEESLMLTGDLNIIDVEWSIQYKIVDPKAWLFKVENRHKTIRDISQSVVNKLVGDRTIFDVIGPKRTNIMVQAQDEMNKIFTQYELGINVVAVQLRNIVPPEGTVQDAFEDVNKAIQDMERLINEGKEEYNKEIPKARGQAERLIQEAQGYKSETVNEANGDVARFLKVYDEYRKNPDVTKARLYVEMVEDVFGSGEKTEVIDKNLDNFLPLKNLNGSTQGGQQ
ncbi:MAG: FtsH protease activity modulator HflK [Spirochaetales bacterium]|nr:FtsH protease activity modulator HflK [Spirochaetales bacterium]